ncbi:MAG: T9SS type A sorting domain-containing protein [Bacteroidia bacterium]|nr:T9SS type A sorting domain-containing protein [Bacteroidia bacterium]
MKVPVCLLLIALFLCSFSFKAQINCTDPNPDIVATGNSTVDIDLNNDATVDFRITGASVSGAAFVIVQAGQVGTNNFVLTNGSGSTSCLALNSPISSTSTSWTQMNSTNQQMMSVILGTGSGPWSGVTDQYLGLQFAVGTNTYYGWAKLSFSNSSNTYTLAEYAYNSSAGQPILAGQGCGSLGSPTFSLPLNGCTNTTLNLSANTGTATAVNYTWIASPNSGVVFSSSGFSTTNVSFSTAGVYSITLAVLAGTTIGVTTNTISITVTPTVVLSPTSAAICSGSTATITASGATSYSWSPATNLSSTTGSAVVVSPSPLATYTVTGTTGACSSTAQITIVSAPPPNIAISPPAASLPSICAGSTLALTAFGANTYTWTSGAFTSPVIQQSVVITAPGNYTVAGADPFGCTSISTITVASASPLTIGFSNPVFTTCIESNFPKLSKVYNVNVSGALNYTLFPYSQYNQQLTPGNFQVRINANTCFTVVGWTSVCSGTSIICTTVMPQPSVTVTPSISAFVCVGGTIPLTVSNPIGGAGPFTYSWTESLASPLSLNSYTLQTVQSSPSANTTYTVSVKDAEGCVSEDAVVNVLIQDCTSLDQAAMETLQVLLYPNPASNKIYLNMENLPPVNSISLIDLSGRIVVSKMESNNNSLHAVNVENLQKGIYFIQVDFRNGNKTKEKFIKE